VDLDEAIKYHEKAIDIADKTGNIRMKGYALMNASDCLIMKRDDLSRALNYSDMALQIFNKIDERMAISLTYINYANIHRIKKEWEGAVAHFEKALEICRELGTPYNLGDILFEYGLMLKEKGDDAEANKKFAQSLKIFETLQNKELIEKIKKEMAGQ
jgi:tetratricopeptide (TPR) repeat protein